MIFTLEYKKRTIDALVETEDALEKELKYSVDLRNTKHVAHCQSHILKLKEMIKVPVGSQITVTI